MKTQTVKLVDLKLDMSYRQPLAEAAVDRMATNVQTDGIRHRICVNRRDTGDLYVIDGALRVAAALELGLDEVEAEIVEVGRHREVAMFLTMNTAMRALR